MAFDRLWRPTEQARTLAAFVLPAALLMTFPSKLLADTRGAIEADYRAAVDKADKDRVDRLVKLALSQTGAEAEATFMEVFRFAVGADRYKEAEPAAERVLTVGTLSREVTFLAYLVNVIAEADRGAYDEAMKDLKAFVGSRFVQEERLPEAQTRTVLAIGEAMVRKLLHGGRFADAHEVCDLIVQNTKTPAIQEHFQGYLHRLAMVGKAAPAINGRDADGEPVSLEKLKGKVVLVVFWASWCPPCVENLPYLNAVAERYGKDGFTVLGVNVDEGPDREKLVRKFIVEFAVPWPTVMNGQGDADFAKTFGVKEIPASVLVGRDGKVLNFDLTVEGLSKAVEKAIGNAQP